MKKILLSVLFVLSTILVFGQNGYQDVVYLKNGSIIRGILIEQVPNKSIKVETADGSVFVYQIDDVEKITKERPVRNRTGLMGDSLEDVGLKSGYKGIVELGYQFGVGSLGMDRLKLNIINGYQFNPYFSAGVGTGLRYYLDADEVLIPVFADLRGNFLDRKLSPYFSVGIGYSFDASNSFDGVGFLLNPSVGISLKISGKSALNFGVGYEMQNMDYYIYDYYSGWKESTENSGAISINIGYSF